MRVPSGGGRQVLISFTARGAEVPSGFTEWSWKCKALSGTKQCCLKTEVEVYRVSQEGSAGLILVSHLEGSFRKEEKQEQSRLCFPEHFMLLRIILIRVEGKF